MNGLWTRLWGAKGFGDVRIPYGPFASVDTDMTTIKRAIRQGSIRLGPVWVVGLMVLWGFVVIAPAALPH